MLHILGNNWLPFVCKNVGNISPTNIYFSTLRCQLREYNNGAEPAGSGRVEYLGGGISTSPTFHHPDFQFWVELFHRVFWNLITVFFQDPKNPLRSDLMYSALVSPSMFNNQGNILHWRQISLSAVLPCLSQITHEEQIMNKKEIRPACYIP